MYKAVLLLAFALTACGPDYWLDNDKETFDAFAADSRSSLDIALDIFASEHGQLHPTCEALLPLARFDEMSPDRLAERCGFKVGAAGACFLQADRFGPRFAILPELAGNKHIEAHEFLHFMLACHYGPGSQDAWHIDQVWSHIDPGAMGHRSAPAQDDGEPDVLEAF